MTKQYELFGGKVTAIDFLANEGPQTIGVISPGEFRFGSDCDEVITITSGVLSVKRDDDLDYVDFVPFESFKVKDGTAFEVKAIRSVSYLCQRF